MMLTGWYYEEEDEEEALAAAAYGFSAVPGTSLMVRPPGRL